MAAPPRDKQVVPLTPDTRANFGAQGVHLCQVAEDGVTATRWGNLPAGAAVAFAHAILSYYVRHSGCGQCEFDGMARVYLDTLAFLPPSPTTTFYVYQGERDTCWFYQVCEFCNPDGIIPQGFVPIPTDVVEAAIDAYCEVL